MSHPSWVCGLKQIDEYKQWDWQTSHPSWVCGLKHLEAVALLVAHVSHPSWVCGLKLLTVIASTITQKVTPFVGVWIETSTSGWKLTGKSSHPSWVCGLKQDIFTYAPECDGHTLRGCVD